MELPAGHMDGFPRVSAFCEDINAEPLYVGFAGERACSASRGRAMSEMGWVGSNFVDAIDMRRAQNDTWGKCGPSKVMRNHLAQAC